MNKCLFVGSFNPITISHEKIALDLLNNKIIDYLYFLPVNSQKKDLITINERINMINLITNSSSETLNIYNYSQTGLFNYNILTKINRDYQITHLVMGSDLFQNFENFFNYQNIFQEYKLIIINRSSNIEKLIQEKYLAYQNKIIVINKNYPGSSTLAKKMLNKNENKYLNKKVLTYIKQKHLYN